MKIGVMLSVLVLSFCIHAEEEKIPVNVTNFVRAESDMYFKRNVQKGYFGKLGHSRQPTSIDNQTIVRMNRDTLYSMGVFDLKASPVTVILPDVGRRFMSLMDISQDHYNSKVVYAPGSYTFSYKDVGTRYVTLIVRTLVNADQSDDILAANRAQDAITVEQKDVGNFSVPNWDSASQTRVRDSLEQLAKLGGITNDAFGSQEEVEPVMHLIATAGGWGGNPAYAAMYDMVVPKKNDGKTVHTLTVKDVPVDGFWSISVYNSKGYFQKNFLEAYSLNNLTTKASADGSYTIQFGGCNKQTLNCLPITPGWNYGVRMYRPRKSLLEGEWTFPKATPVQEKLRSISSNIK